MTGVVPDPGTSETDTLSVSARCVVVVKAAGVYVQQPSLAPPWLLDPAKLELIAAIDAGSITDITDIKQEIATRAGVTEQELNDFWFGLRFSTNVIVGPKPNHAPAPDHPSLATEPPPFDLGSDATISLLTPMALRLVGGRFEVIDHAGRRTATLSALETAALGHLGRPTTARSAMDAQRAASGPLALDEAELARLLARLEVAGILTVRDAAEADLSSDAVDEDAAEEPVDPGDHAAIVRRVFDVHAEAQSRAEAERERVTGVKRVKVIPVAFDMSTPAGLGMIVAHAKAYEGGKLEERYDFRTDWVWSDARLDEFTAEPAIYLFSNYEWSHERCIAVSARIKQRSPASITIHGGPDTPKYEEDVLEHFANHLHVDVTVRGEGEMTAAHALETLATVIGDEHPDLSVLDAVPGLSYRGADGTIHRTEDRDRIADLDTLPSPYLTGLFDVFAGVPDLFVTFETNRGCPYGCTFCDWGSATTSRIRKFDIDRVFAEIDWCQNFGVQSVSVADANFGIFARDVEIAQHVAEVHEQSGRPKAFGVSYAKNTVKHVRPIISILADAGIMTQGVLSLQTMDPETLKVIHRSNIKTDQYDQLASEMRLAHLPLMVELMMGLPGQSLASFADDLQQCIDRGVPARINVTTLLVNSPMNEPSYREEHRIETSEPVGPGTNNVVISTSTFSQEDYGAMTVLRSDFMFYENWSALRHIAPFIRQETGTREIDLYQLIRSRTTERPQEWPSLHAMAMFGADLMAPPHSWALVLADLRRFVISELGVADTGALDAALASQHALVPAYGRTFPDVVMLDHDVVAWTEEIMATKARGHLHDWESLVPRLHEYGPGQLVVDDPDEIVRTSIGVSIATTLIGFNWEFDSPLSRASVAATQFADWVTETILTEPPAPDAAPPVPVQLGRTASA